MEYLFLSFIDLSVALSKTNTLLLMIGVVLFEFALVFTFPHTFKKQKKTFWYEQETENDQKLPYNKKNLIQKWFLCGTKGRVPIVIRIVYIIKNITMICGEIFSLAHIIFYLHILSNIARIVYFVWIGLFVILSIWQALNWRRIE
jgi:hypothetical protein